MVQGHKLAGAGNRLEEEVEGQMCKEEGRTVVGAGTWMETGTPEEQVQEVELYGGGRGGDLSLLSLSSPFPEGSNLWVTETYCPTPCLFCHDLCDVVRDVGCCCLCRICCTSLCTPFHIVDTFLSPSDHGLQDLVPLVHTVEAPEEGCGSGSHRGSESG